METLTRNRLKAQHSKKIYVTFDRQFFFKGFFIMAQQIKKKYFPDWLISFTD